VPWVILDGGVADDGSPTAVLPMAVIAMLFRSELRHRWRSWLMLGLLIAVVGGLVLAGIAAGRRTASAYPQFVKAYGYDASTFSPDSLSGLRSLPDVVSVTRENATLVGPPTCSCGHVINPSDFGLVEIGQKDLGHYLKLVSGRMPDPASTHEVLASFNFARDVGVRPGTRVRVPLYAHAQRAAVLGGANVKTAGPSVTLTVVGIEAADIEFQSSSYPYYDLYANTAFDRRYGQQAAEVASYFVRLHHGAADLPQFQAEAQKLGALGVNDLDTTTASNESSIHPQATGWWILAAVVAFVGLIAIFQALSRQAVVESDFYPTVSALGISRRKLVVWAMCRTLVITALGAIGAIAVAFLLSPFTPVGEARLAEPSTGFAFDAFVLILGGLLTFLVIGGIGFLPAFKTARLRDDEATQPPRSSRIMGLLRSAGAPPSALIGVGRAVERGRGRRAIPVGSAIVGLILAVAALSATAVFGASLSHLTTTPALYGQPFDAWFSGDGVTNTTNPVLTSLLADHQVDRITEGIGSDVTINGHTVDALAGKPLRGSMLLTTINGHLPEHRNQITLGASTLRQVGARVGSLVRITSPAVQGGKHQSSYRVVGTSAFPPDFGAGGLGTGAVFTIDGLAAAECGSGPAARSCERGATFGAFGTTYLISVTPDAAGQRALQALARQYPSQIESPMPPNDLVNFGQAVNFPLILSLIVALFGAATLGHVLVVSVARRRRDSGILKALGFLRRQVFATVVWQTTTIGLIGIVVGVPTGIALGRVVWRAFAENLGVVPVALVPGAATGIVVLGTLTAAAVLALWPARMAARDQASALLREE
jgi:FtsX-like permease family